MRQGSESTEKKGETNVLRLENLKPCPRPGTVKLICFAYDLPPDGASGDNELKVVKGHR